MIAEQAPLLAAGTAAAAVVLSVALFAVKVIRWRMATRRAARRATYIGALGEMIARGVMTEDTRVWARDPTFVEVVVEYLGVVTGEEGRRLEEIVRASGLRVRLAREVLSPVPARRLRGAAALSVMTDRTVEWVLLAALRDVLPEVRIQAASGLSSIRSATAIPRLIDVLRHDEPWVAARVADQLVRYGPDAVPHLLHALRHGTDDGPLDSASMQLVSRVLGLIGDLRACPVLRERLRDPVPEVRIAAASALGSAGTISAVSALLESLGDEDWRVKARAASSLATFSHPASLGPLSAAVEDPSWWVRQNAAEALTEIPGGFAALVGIIEWGSEPAREAAVTHLGLSGAIRAARERAERGDGEPWEQRLIELIDAERRIAS